MPGDPGIHPALLVECRFELREPASAHPGKFRYRRLYRNLPMGHLGPHLAHPPLVGDTIPVYDREQGIGGRFCVVERHWEWTDYGSPSWPLASPHPTKPRVLIVRVVPAPALYADEAPADDADDE